MKSNVFICPPCGENVALATKRGANKVNPILPLLPRLTAVLPPQGREITACGFTLIELLVVVLIIGILAAVAVPQYQNAVLKTRLVQTITACDVLFKASRMYWLANGKWPTSFAPLDIEMPGTLNNAKTTVIGEYFQCDYIASSPSIMCYVRRNGKNLNHLGIRVFFETQGRRWCFASPDNEQYNQI